MTIAAGAGVSGGPGGGVGEEGLHVARGARPGDGVDRDDLEHGPEAGAAAIQTGLSAGGAAVL